MTKEELIKEIKSLRKNTGLYMMSNAMDKAIKLAEQLPDTIEKECGLIKKYITFDKTKDCNPANFHCSFCDTIIDSSLNRLNKEWGYASNYCQGCGHKIIRRAKDDK